MVGIDIDLSLITKAIKNQKENGWAKIIMFYKIIHTIIDQIYLIEMMLISSKIHIQNQIF